MILDRVTNAAQYAALSDRLAAAIEWLGRTDLSRLADGRHEIDGDRLFVLVAASEPKGDTAPLEAHRRYIDIQVTLTGDERIGWLPAADCSQVTQPYDSARDIEFFADKSETYVNVPAGTMAIFFPADAHAPLAGKSPVRKAVVKVAM